MSTPARTGRLALAVVALAIVLAACGGSDAAPGGSSTTSPPVTTAEGGPAPAPEDTTPTTVAPRSETCLSLASKAVELLADTRRTMRGIVGPSAEDEERLRAEGQAILDEARALECPIPASVEQFLSGDVVSG